MFKYIPFSLLGLLTLAMVAATVLEKLCGSVTAMAAVYHSPWMIALWIATVVSAIVYIGYRNRGMSMATMLLHLSFVVILVGAAVTWLFGRQGKVTLSVGGDAVDCYELSDGSIARFPFELRLRECGVEYYPGTSSAMDYFSEIEISAIGSSTTGRIAMNKILDVRSYRFYQTSLGDGSSTLSVSYDPWGIGISYCGYCLMALSMLVFFFSRKSHFRRLLRVVSLVILLFSSSDAMAVVCENQSDPKVLQRPLAKNFGKLYAYWGGRVVPLQTVARDFCLKIYGKDSYKGFTSEQVLTGWIFYYDDWKKEPFVKIRGPKVKEALGTDGRFVSLADFFDRSGYLLESALSEDPSDASLRAADEKVNLISLICTGRGVKIFPVRTDCIDKLEWYSWVDYVDPSVSSADRFFMTSSMESVAREIAHGRFNNANDKLSEIREQQIEMAGKCNLPSATRINAEFLYNRVSCSFPVALSALFAGIVAFVLFCRRMISPAVGNSCWLRFCSYAILFVASMLWCYLTLVIALRWIIGAHMPLGNGFETMLALAWISNSLTLLLYRHIPVILPMGIIVCGLALMVALMGESNPAVTNLMPVLTSPLLSVHVMLIMISYALFAVIMLDSIAALFLRHHAVAVGRLADVSLLLLYPAVFLLGIGIFIGAVWANQSWGRYWGWDPKETWALITFIIYSFPLHTSSFACFKRPVVIHRYLFFSFLAVLMTYFGVNYLLTGLHSYVS